MDGLAVDLDAVSLAGCVTLREFPELRPCGEEPEKAMAATLGCPVVCLCLFCHFLSVALSWATSLSSVSDLLGVLRASSLR